MGNSPLGGLLSGLGSGLLGNVVGAISNAQNNAAQIQMARENREWQTSERVAQNDWNLDMWNKNNEYNSASSQVQRYNDAGINPYLAMYGGAGSAGSSQQITSASPPGAPNMPQTHGFTPDTSGIQNALYQYALNKAQLSKVTAETSGINLENAWIDKKNDWQVNNYKLDYEGKLLANEFNNRTMSSRVKLQDEIYNAQVVQNALIGLKSDEQRILNAALPAQQNAELLCKCASYVDTIASANLKYAQKAQCYAQIKLYYAQCITEGFKQQNLASSTALNYAGVDKTNAETGKIQEETTGIAMDNNKKVIDYGIAQRTAESVIDRIIAENSMNTLSFNRDIGYLKRFNKEAKSDPSVLDIYHAVRYHNETFGDFKIPGLIGIISGFPK